MTDHDLETDREFCLIHGYDHMRHDRGPIAYCSECDDAPREFPIPIDCWGEFTARIAKLNKRAKRLGVEPVSFTAVREAVVERRHTYKIDGVERTRAYNILARIVVMHGSALRLADWQFIAKVEPLADRKSVLFHTVPGSEHKVDERLRAVGPAVCEHCNKRRRRSETFVVRHAATGEQKQVGRQCLADFTGINTPEKIASVISWLHSFQNLDSEFDGFFGSHFEVSIDTREALALTSAYISAFGWVPRSAQMPNATANVVSRHFGLVPPDSARREMAAMRQAVETQPMHYARADKTLAWVRAALADKTNKSDYERNLVTLLAGDLATARHLGLVCSALPAWQRAMDMAVEYAKRRETTKNSQWVGTPKERLRGVAVTIDAVRAMGESAWGPATLIKFHDDAGNVLTWFASSDREYDRGAKVILDGTVKEHREYNGIKETQLSRVVLHEPVEGKAA